MFESSMFQGLYSNRKRAWSPLIDVRVHRPRLFYETALIHIWSRSCVLPHIVNRIIIYTLIQLWRTISARYQTAFFSGRQKTPASFPICFSISGVRS